MAKAIKPLWQRALARADRKRAAEKRCAEYKPLLIEPDEAHRIAAEAKIRAGKKSWETRRANNTPPQTTPHAPWANRRSQRKETRDMIKALKMPVVVANDETDAA